MREFKIGDTVRCTGLNVFGDGECIGYEGKVTSVCKSIGIDALYTMDPDNLELIKPAKPSRKELKKKIKKLERSVENLCYDAACRELGVGVQVKKYGYHSNHGKDLNTKISEGT